MTTIEMQMTHDEYKHEMHRDYTRVIRGRKHVLVYDSDGYTQWIPVKIVPRWEVLA